MKRPHPETGHCGFIPPGLHGADCRPFFPHVTAWRAVLSAPGQSGNRTSGPVHLRGLPSPSPSRTILLQTPQQGPPLFTPATAEVKRRESGGGQRLHHPRRAATRAAPQSVSVSSSNRLRVSATFLPTPAGQAPSAFLLPGAAARCPQGDPPTKQSRRRRRHIGCSLSCGCPSVRQSVSGGGGAASFPPSVPYGTAPRQAKQAACVRVMRRGGGRNS